jgi:hypothetical protein
MKKCGGPRWRLLQRTKEARGIALGRVDENADRPLIDLNDEDNLESTDDEDAHVAKKQKSMGTGKKDDAIAKMKLLGATTSGQLE